MKKFTGLFFMMILLVSTAFAQKEETKYIFDPYHNPKLWKQIIANPTDTALWAKYMGRASWAAMPMEEKRRIELWQGEISIYRKNVRSDGTPTSSPTATVVKLDKKAQAIKEAQEDGKVVITHKDKINFDAFVTEYLKDSPQVKDLKKNIYANFKVIEDSFFERFADFDKEYTYYHDVHPSEDYSFEKWIEEHEAKIRKWKQARMNQASSEFFLVAD